MTAGKSRPTGATSNNSTYNEPRRLYVFEVPETASFPGTQQDTFSSGNFSRWTATAGTFAVVPSGATRVLRQSSLAGDAGAHLTAVDWTDQSIEADMRPLEFAGAGRWFGLVTRRTDAQNYYYVTFRSPNVISLRRMRDGVYTELASTHASANFQTGRNYRMRLESVGDQHAVFIDGFPHAARQGQHFDAGSSRRRWLPHAVRRRQCHREWRHTGAAASRQQPARAGRMAG